MKYEFLKTLSRLSSVTPLLITLLWVADSATAETPSRSTKLIEWSAVEPNSEMLIQNVGQFETSPFDGFVYRLTTKSGDQIMWDCWGESQYELADFEHAIERYHQVPFKKSYDVFVRMNVSPGNVSWSDGSGWKRICHNYEVAAQVAKRIGAIGLLFDSEQYSGRPFDTTFELNASTPKHKLQQLAYRRGAEWIRSINRVSPEISILLPFAYRASRKTEEERFRVKNYELLAPFLDGVLSACTEKTTLIDGWEYAYGYRTEWEFQRARRIILEDVPHWAENPKAYRKHFHCAFGLWFDYSIHDYQWNPTEFSSNFHQPQELTQRMVWAQKHTDRYVWMYHSEVNWWTGEKLPKEYRRAVLKAKTTALQGESRRD